MGLNQASIAQRQEADRARVSNLPADVVGRGGGEHRRLELRLRARHLLQAPDRTGRERERERERERKRERDPERERPRERERERKRGQWM